MKFAKGNLDLALGNCSFKLEQIRMGGIVEKITSYDVTYYVGISDLSLRVYNSL